MKNLKKNVSPRVEAILKKYPEARDSDEALFFYLLRQFYHITDKTPFIEVMRLIDNNSLPSLESIRRCRQKIQEKGDYIGVKKELRNKLNKDVTEQIRNW